MNKVGNVMSIWNVFVLGLTGVFVLGVIGWVMNISKIFHSNFANISGELAVRIIGVFIAPVGAVLGWF